MGHHPQRFSYRGQSSLCQSQKRVFISEESSIIHSMKYKQKLERKEKWDMVREEAEERVTTTGSMGA